MYKHLLDNLNTAVLLFDADLKLCYVNTAAEIILADSARQLVGISAEQLFKSSDEAFLNNLKHCRDA
ncbi:MAG: PAS domain-containing protein, partial [Methylococcaceae bacterium]